MRNGKHTLFTVLFILLFTAIAGGQETTGRMNLAEERISVSASSATVLQWFNKIEREARITLSYNPSHIDLGKVCRITTSGTISIGQLLDKLLEGYTFKTTVIPPRKLAIQVKRIENFRVSGTVSEMESGERLYGAVVILDDGTDTRRYAVTDANGMFQLYVPEGKYRMLTSYIGYLSDTIPVRIDRERRSS